MPQKQQAQAAPDFIPAESSPDFIPADQGQQSTAATSSDQKPEQPGFFKRAGQALGIPTSMDEVNAFESRMKSPRGALEMSNPAVMAGEQIYNYGKGVLGNIKDAAQEGKEAGQNIAAGQPILPNMGKALYGGVSAGVKSIPLIGNSAENVGEDVARKNYSGAAGGALGTIAPFLAGEVAPKVRDFVKAESDPDALYRSYLKPVSGSPMPAPSAPKPVMRAILRDMEAAGESGAAERFKNGNTTVGDLDIVRQRANRLARSIYRSPGNYSPGIAEGADDLASSIREKTYPFIESSQNMEPGSLRGIKKLQGKSMEIERNPTFTNKVIKHVGGAVGGGAIGYKIGGIPGSTLGMIAGERLAEPLADAADRGILGLRTKMLASRLPAPGLAPRMALPSSRILPPIMGEESGGEPSFNEFTNPSTRATRLGLLLPEGKPTIQLPSSMEPIEPVPPGASTPKGRFTEDTRTGRLKKQYLTGSANQ